jgi:cellulose synthase operon protein YhjQ
LADLLSERNIPSCILELDPISHLKKIKPSRADLVTNPNDTLIVPFDDVSWDSSSIANIRMQLSQYRPLHDQTIVLMDTARFPNDFTDQAAAQADLVINVVSANPESFLAIGELQELFSGASNEEARRPHLFHLLNQIDSRIVLQRDIITILRDTLDERLLNHLIHFDEAIPESTAKGLSLSSYAPRSQARADLQGLANWMLKVLDHPHHTQDLTPSV